MPAVELRCRHERSSGGKIADLPELLDEEA